MWRSWKGEGKRANEEFICANPANLVRPSSFVLPTSLDFHLAVGAGNPDLFRARAAGGFPIHGAAHDVPHLGEPPMGPGAPVPGYGMTVPVQL